MSEDIGEIFIIGNPRSGTSLLRLMLQSHPNILIPPECHFFLWLETKYGGWHTSMLPRFLDDLYLSRKFETWEVPRKELKKFLLSRKIENYGSLVKNIYLFYGMINCKGKEIIYWGDKNKLWKEKLETVYKYFPNAIFIHIIRDGRDVTCSYKGLMKIKSNSIYAPKLPVGIDEIAKKWSTNVKFISTFLSELEPRNKMLIKYEDLLIEPVKSISSVIRTLDLPFSFKTMEYYKNVKYEPVEFLDWKKKLNGPLDISNIGKYKKELTTKEIELFNSIANEELIKYNYI